LGIRLQTIGVAVLSSVALEVFIPGFWNNVAQQFRINALLGQFREQEEQEFMMKVEDVTAAQTSPNFSPPGGL